MKIAGNLVEIVPDASGLSSQLLNFTNIGNDVVVDSHFFRWSYNLETILAEKLQTVLARGILNTRMRDFYDIRMLLDTYEDKINKAVLKDAFAATCKKRGTDNLQEQSEEIVKIIESDDQFQVLWRAYQKKYSYAAEIDYASVISGVRKLMDWIR